MTTIDIVRQILPYTIYSVFDNVRERTSEKETYMGYPEAIGNVGTAIGGNSVYRKASDKENEKGTLSFDSVFRDAVADNLRADSGSNDIFFSEGEEDLDDSIGLDELEELDRTAEEQASQNRARAMAFPVISAEDELSGLLFSDDEMSDAFEGLM